MCEIVNKNRVQKETLNNTPDTHCDCIIGQYIIWACLTNDVGSQPFLLDTVPQLFVISCSRQCSPNDLFTVSITELVLRKVSFRNVRFTFCFCG